MRSGMRVDESKEVMLKDINIKYGKVRLVCCVY